jgi:hypothetical protein
LEDIQDAFALEPHQASLAVAASQSLCLISESTHTHTNTHTKPAKAVGAATDFVEAAKHQTRGDPTCFVQASAEKEAAAAEQPEAKQAKKGYEASVCKKDGTRQLVELIIEDKGTTFKRADASCGGI